jgi:ankyrin repeat protein
MPPETPDSLFFPPLHQAAFHGHKDVVTLLLSAGASVSVVDEEVIKPSVKLRQLDISDN